MSELELVRGQRSDETVQLLAKRIEPTIRFVVYGVVVFFVSSFPALFGGVVASLVMHAVGFAKEAVTTQVVAFIMSIVCWVSAWIPYLRWARRKRASARTIVRTGVLCDATVAASTSDLTAQLAVRVAINAAGSAGVAQTWERVVFEHAGLEYAGVAPFDQEPEQGTRTSVLFSPEAPYALAFSPTGNAFVVNVHRRA
ncbi:hypothetical protein BH11MYX1_BH11MYX1_39380 [soil metagenome]